MKIFWRKSAIHSLLELDMWRETIGLPSIAAHLKDTIQMYFENQDFSFYTPGRPVMIRKMSIDLRMLLISVGKSDPYKVFYRFTEGNIEIFLIRHPHQKTI